MDNSWRSPQSIRWLPLFLGLLLVAFGHPAAAEQFNIAVGDTVSDGVPAPGAGRLDAATEDDIYLFDATAGQLVFIETLSQGPGFGGRLRLQLLRPNGNIVFASFFSNPIGRTLLPDAGTYRIRIYTDGTDPSWVGPYSFRIMPITPDQTMPYTMGTTVSDGVPVPGAGRLDVAGAEDYYTFTATAGQLAFFEALSQDPAYSNRLRWQLLKPNGTQVFSSFFTNPIGRILLPDAGEYRIRVYTDGNDSRLFGPYSFRVMPIPPDQTFQYSVGTQVSDGVPAAGAGKLEVAGAEDSYLFNGTEGELLFFQSLTQDPAFKQSLRWQLIQPSGKIVFASFFTNPIGRVPLPETGQYRIRIYTDGNNPAWFGPYSFVVNSLSGDQTFPYAIGATVQDGVPAAGAGRLEAAGAEDFYTFTGSANQVVFFESLGQDAAFKQSLRWQLLRPSGTTVFSSFFTNPQGRTVLPEAGEYRIRLYTDSADPTLFGAYSFQTRGDVTDQQFQINVGTTVSDGIPQAGAGNLETPGSTDNYTFVGRAAQEVIFESISQAPTLQQALRWELLKPSGTAVFSSFFLNPQGRIVLPEAGSYKLRLFTTGNNPAWIGAYSFRLYSPVIARPDFIATLPGKAIDVQFDKYLFNDTAEDPLDELSIALPNTLSEQGCALAIVSEAIRYTPKTGFVGTDHFDYRLVGSFGGTNLAKVTVTVTNDAGEFATVVNLVRTAVGADYCLIGDAGRQYGVEATSDFSSWTPEPTLTMDNTGGVIFHMTRTAGIDRRYFRIRRK